MDYYMICRRQPQYVVKFREQLLLRKEAFNESVD